MGSLVGDGLKPSSYPSYRDALIGSGAFKTHQHTDKGMAPAYAWQEAKTRKNRSSAQPEVSQRQSVHERLGKKRVLPVKERLGPRLPAGGHYSVLLKARAVGRCLIALHLPPDCGV
jgi:hypothetical protein